MGVCSAGRQERPQTDNRQRGVTLLELVVVVCIASVVGFVALGAYHRLLIDVERTTLEQNIGLIQSAVAMQFAALYVAGDKEGLAQLPQRNPMEMMEQPPENYSGEVAGRELTELAPGHWYYDSTSQRLIYLVRNHKYFETALSGTPRAEFFITGQKDQTGQGGEVSMPVIQTQSTYRWLRPWD